MKSLLSFIIAIIFIAIPNIATAGNPDAGLYDPLAPKDAAFIRFLNVNEKSGSRQSATNSKPYMFLKHKEISPYFISKEGKIIAKIGDGLHEIDVEKNNFYTSILKSDDKTILLLNDDANTNRAKSQIQFYNLSEHATASLKANAGKIDIIADIKKDEFGTRQINPVKVQLSIVAEDMSIDLGEKSLERGESYSVFLLENGDNIWVKNEINTTK